MGGSCLLALPKSHVSGSLTTEATSNTPRLACVLASEDNDSVVEGAEPCSELRALQEQVSRCMGLGKVRLCDPEGPGGMWLLSGSIQTSN